MELQPLLDDLSICRTWLIDKFFLFGAADDGQVITLVSLG